MATTEGVHRVYTGCAHPLTYPPQEDGGSSGTGADNLVDKGPSPNLCMALPALPTEQDVAEDRDKLIESKVAVAHIAPRKREHQREVPFKPADRRVDKTPQDRAACSEVANPDYHHLLITLFCFSLASPSFSTTLGTNSRSLPAAPLPFPRAARGAGAHNCRLQPRRSPAL